MAATYSPAASPKDRVRALIDDRRKPWRYDDEEIAYELTRVASGEAGEIQAAIRLLENETGASQVTTSQRQGSWSSSRAVVNPNVDRIRNLSERLALLQTSAPGAVGMSVAESEFPVPCELPHPGDFYA